MARSFSGNYVDAKGLIPSAPNWTLESLDKLVKITKEAIEWTSDNDLVSINVGRDKEEIEFVGLVLREHSLYMQFFSLPTIAYADQFLDDTDRLEMLKTDEVRALEWIIGWCHEGGTLQGRRLLTQFPTLTVSEWVNIWSVADLLAISSLQTYVVDTIYLKFTEEVSNPLPMPTPEAITSLYDNEPYKSTKNALFLHTMFVARFAFIAYNDLDRNPNFYDQRFVQEVEQHRKEKGLVGSAKKKKSLKRPDGLKWKEGLEIDDETINGGKLQECLLQEKNGSEHRDLTLQAGRPRSDSISSLNEKISSVDLSETLPLQRSLRD